MTDTQAFASMYERIGGAVTIDHLVESFYRRMDALPEVQIVRAKHAADLDSTKRVLKHYLAEWMGRPKLIRPRKAIRGCARAILAFRSAVQSETRG
jgi:hemoglobin